MIENLDGIHETVNYRGDTNVRLYDNDDFEAYPTHWHTSVEIIMPTENDYQVYYENYNCTLKEQDIVFICPGVLHRLPAIQGKRYIFQAEMSSVSPIREVESVLSIIAPVLLVSPKTCPDIYEHVHQIMCEIVDEYHQAAPLYEIAIYSRLLDMITTFGRSHSGMRTHFSTDTTKQREYIEKFTNICNFINEHCTEELTLDSIAHLSGFSKYHFTRLFKQFTNVSFYKYLNQKRIARAEQLLINPNMSITDVSLSCGFSSLSAFIRMFKLMKGCTPSQFRAMYNL